MLNTIKMLCNISNTDKDDLINFYIEEISNRVIDYCNIDKEALENNAFLNSFIKFKVAEIIGNNLSFTPSGGGEVVSNGVVKAVSKGDTSITYATGAEIEASSKSGFSSSLMFNNKEKELLNKHRALVFD